MSENTDLGTVLNNPELYTMIAEDRFREAWLLLDTAMKGHPAPHKDRHYIQFNETLSFCLLKDGNLIQADAVFDRVRQSIHRHEYSANAQKIDVELRRAFEKTKRSAYPLAEAGQERRGKPNGKRGSRPQQRRPAHTPPPHEPEPPK